MKHISSNLTLPLRVFVPIAWLGFFGAMLAVAVSMSDEISGVISVKYIIISSLIFLITGIIIFWNSVWKIYRVDVDETSVYITNYWITVKYAPESFDRLEEKKLLLLPLGKLILKEKGKFGKSMYFIPSRSRILALKKLVGE